MAKRRSPWSGLLKWLIVPAGVGAIGYFVLGPQFGGRVVTEVKKVQAKLEGQTAPATPASPAKSPYSPPEVTVTAQPLRDKPAPKPKRRRRRRPAATTTAPTTPPPVAAPVDEGSVGGTDN